MAKSRYDYLGSLKFDIKDVPEWQNDGIHMSTLLSDIVDFYRKYLNLPEKAKDFAEKSFAKLMATRFVFNVNVGESIGTQTADGTQAVLEDFWDSNQQSRPADRTKQETINVYKALEKLYTIHKTDMEQTGRLTVQLICDVHTVLMSELHEEAGNIRKRLAYVPWKNKDHIYPEPKVAEQLFYTCIDHHNIHISTYEQNFTKNPPSVESVSYLFRCAARLGCWLRC